MSLKMEVTFPECYHAEEFGAVALGIGLRGPRTGLKRIRVGLPRDLNGDDQRQQPAGKRGAELEPIEFRRHERMQRADDGSSSQEIHTATSQLAGAGAREHEAPPILRFKKGVDDVQELGHTLDFIENHGRAPGRPPDEITQSLGPRGQFARDVGLEEIDDECAGQGVPEPGRLAGSAGPEQEEALPGRGSCPSVGSARPAGLGPYCSDANGRSTGIRRNPAARKRTSNAKACLTRRRRMKAKLVAST